MSDLDAVVKKMAQLKSIGIQFSLDDFGTGYSNLAYLRRLPLDGLKVDKMFIKDVLSSAGDAAITNMIITLAQELNIAVVAEGVETTEQRQFLIEGGCHRFQGYLYSRPLPINEFNRYVFANKKAESIAKPVLQRA